MTLAPELARDTRPLRELSHAKLLLANDSRWPWLILVPYDPHITELHQLDTTVRHGFMDAVNACSEALQQTTGCQSINIAMLGNVVAQLHCHVVARTPGDSNWPGPIWGHGKPVRYDSGSIPTFASALCQALDSFTP